MAVLDLIPLDERINNHDIRDTLNAYNGAVGNDHTSFFTEDAEIAMWSKFKPVVDPRVSIPLAEWIESGYRDSEGTCGLTILHRETSMADFHTYLDDGSAMWDYIPPQGGTSEPRRLGDFRGYNPKAVNPVGDIVTSGFSEGGDVDVFGDVEFSIDVADALENNLMLGDIRIGGPDGTPLTEFYLGIYAWKSSSQWYYKTGTTPIGESYNLTTTIPLVTGEWKIIPFFSSVAQDGIEGDGQAAVLLGANVKAKNFTIISTNDKFVLIVNGTWNAEKTMVQNIFVEVQNKMTTDADMSGIGVQLRATYGTEDYNVGNPATSYYNGSEESTLTIPAGSSVTTEIGQFENIKLGAPDSKYEYYLSAFGYVGDTLYRHSAGIEEEEIE